MMEEQNFRIYIKNLRMQDNLSITEVAKLAYMNRKTLSRLEDGNTKISIDNLIALSAVYKKDLIQKYNDYMHYVDDEIMEKMNIIENKLVDMEYNDLLDDLKIFEKFLNKNLYIIQYYNFIKGVY
ncbi:helix-turn-helix transcriptional regulator, partial [Helcococcus ovis]|uniref:helix-turn-helix domain-containing protein n=1 Tax=Helcococcus ovis TaxID=72026 RepID=UPI0038BDB57A